MIKEIEQLISQIYDVICLAAVHEKKYLLNGLKVVYDITNKCLELEVNNERSDRTED